MMASNSREMQVGEKYFIIYDHDIDIDAPIGADLVGASLWDCAITLAHYLPIYARSHPFSGKRAIEIGAGTGLPGLVAASLGARTTLTDLPHLLPGLRRNVEANAAALSDEDVRVLPLEWGTEDLSAVGEDRPFDLVLMSDLLYNVSAVPNLCRTLRAVSDRGSEILMAYELREGTTECFRVLREWGFGWVKIGNEELDPVWQSEDIGIFRVTYLK
eukprot:TRINITY_DN16911_c0_g1_i1.p1 TRINITY_DN16911_c0_g1~~TRINITY_DN16911_c0_g1_i1.p1  ORF type:complete len:216 (-),score=7.56 TRINITY_DN16911_c0_g1_i1:553-1200(-)